MILDAFLKVFMGSSLTFSLNQHLLKQAVLHTNAPENGCFFQKRNLSIWP